MGEPGSVVAAWKREVDRIWECEDCERKFYAEPRRKAACPHCALAASEKAREEAEQHFRAMDIARMYAIEELEHTQAQLTTARESSPEDIVARGWRLIEAHTVLMEGPERVYLCFHHHKRRELVRGRGPDLATALNQIRDQIGGSDEG